MFLVKMMGFQVVQFRGWKSCVFFVICDCGPFGTVVLLYVCKVSVKVSGLSG